MLEEFITLIESEKEAIKKVLKPHIQEKIFKRLVGGFFDETQKRFVAFAFFVLKKSMFYEYDYLFELSKNGHSAIYFSGETLEKTKKYINKSQYQSKSIEELIEKGIYKSLLVTYWGEFDFNEWNILRSPCFSDSKNRDELLESKLSRINKSIKDHFFTDPIFEETSEHNERLMNFSSAGVEDLPTSLPVESRPFAGHSTLVEMVRTEKKQKLNLLFEDYIKKIVCEPLIISRKTDYPARYQTVWGFYGNDCNFLIPSHRQFCLIIFVIKGVEKKSKSTLEFYFYDLRKDKLYRWVYFELSPYSEKFDYDLIQRIFSPISKLDDMAYINNPKCNFDDTDFWNNFVLKKENDKYIYLVETKLLNRY